MKMKPIITPLFVSLSMTFLAFSTYAASLLPPYYLQVPGWQQCTKEKKMSSWRAVCMPLKKPSNCLRTSWKLLQAKAHLPSCRVE